MPNYDKTDLTSTLNYIKSEYGTSCFKDGKIIAFLSDLAPSLKREKSLLKKLVDKGLMKEIVENASADETTQRRIIYKTRMFLVDDEFIQPDIADLHINILSDVFGYRAKSVIPQQSSQNQSQPEPQQTVPVQQTELIKKGSHEAKHTNNNSSEAQTHTMTTHEPTQKNKDNQYLSDLFTEIMSQMVTCPAGSFLMGSKETIYKQPEGFFDALFGTEVIQNGELGRFKSELQHRVTISSEFKIGKYPVTQKLYEAVMGNNPSNYKDENNPVERVSWNDAKGFCDKLNKMFISQLPKGYWFDLPTEAQWEYACRAGTTTALNNGKDLISEEGRCCNLDEVAWYSENSGGATHSVGQKKPNAWGIYDMHGNVREWCRDWDGDYPNENVTDPVGPSAGLRRVNRGGAWNHIARLCRSARRGCNDPDERLSGVGFRLALVPNS